MTTPPAPRRPPTEALVDLHGRSPWSILPALLTGFFMIMVDTTIVNIAVPTLVKAFDASLVQVGWVNSSYLLTFAVLLLVTGRLGDRFGPKWIYVAGLVLFTFSSLACGLSPTIGWLIAARAVQGVGGALMTPQTMAMITRVFPATQRGAALGLWGSVAGVATITGPLLGGVLVESAGWEWIFFVNLPVGVLALFFALTRLPSLPTHSRSFDLIGMWLSIVGVFLVVFGVQEGATYDWGTIRGPITVWVVIGAGLVVLGVFGWWQLRLGDDALLPMRLFARRNFLLGNIAGAAVSFTMIGVFFPLTLFLQEILGLSPVRAALVSLPGSVLSGLIAPFAGRLSDRISGKWVVAAGFTTMSAGIGWVAALIAPDVPAWHLVFPMAVFSMGVSLVMSPLANLVTHGLSQRDAGAGAGAYNTNRQVGGVIGSATIVAVLTSRLAATIPAAAATAAAGLPETARAPFLQAFAAAGGLAPGGSAPITLPDTVPAALADQIRAAAVQAVHSGFATAATQTVLVAAAVLVIGLLVTLAMDRSAPAPAPSPSSPEPASA
jgi:EmrB/QacA subfamily drug resistance transporter